MSLRGNDAQTTKRLDLLMVLGPLGPDRRNLLLFLSRIQRGVSFQRFNAAADVATQHDVGAAARHVGGNRDHFLAPSLGHDVRLARMLLGVEHLVRQLFLVQ